MVIATVALLMLGVTPLLSACSADPGPTAPGDAASGCWEQVPGPELDAPIADVTAAYAVSASDVWAVGQVGSAGGDVSRTLTMHWDGTKWSLVPSPNGSPPDGGRNNLYGVSGSSSDNVWAVGAYTTSGSQFRALAMRWDGTKWSLVSTPSLGEQGSQLNTVAALGPDNVWAAGNSVTAQQQDGQMLVLRWDGKAWSRSPLPPDVTHNLLSLAARTPGDIWAVGTQALHWDGKSWSILPTPEGAYLDGVTAAPPGAVWVVGNDSDKAITLRWDGKKLNNVPVPAALGKAFLHETVALPNGDVWAVGENVDNPGKRQPILMKWTGEQWTLYPNPLPGSDARLQGVTAASGSLWAVGSQTAAGKSKPLLLRYSSEPCAR